MSKNININGWYNYRNVALINRDYADDIQVKLINKNGDVIYGQRFWVDMSDAKAVKRCRGMKAYNIPSNFSYIDEIKTKK